MQKKANYNLAARKANVDLNSYPSVVEFSDRVPDLVKLKEKEGVSTVGRLFFREQKAVLYHCGAELEVDFPDASKTFRNGDMIAAKGDYSNNVLHVTDATMCSKCIGDFNRLDPELVRGTGAELIVRPEKRDMLVFRANVFRETRAFLDSQGFMEVETPILLYRPETPSAISTFSTKFKGDDHNYELRICPEDRIKQLLLGFDKIYEIGKSFRNGEMDGKHSPEFTLMEYYAAFSNFNSMMSFTTSLIESLSMSLNGTTEVKFKGREVDLKGPWNQITYRELSEEKFGFDIIEAPLKQLRSLVDTKETLPREVLLAMLADRMVPDSDKPTYLTNYPRGVGAPYKQSSTDPSTVEHAELFIPGGLELVDTGTLNNDPVYLKKHVTANLVDKFGSGGEKFIDEGFFQDFELGIPPTCVAGIGMDRLVMVLSSRDDITETMAFPFKVSMRQ